MKIKKHIDKYLLSSNVNSVVSEEMMQIAITPWAVYPKANMESSSRIKSVIVNGNIGWQPFLLVLLLDTVNLTRFKLVLFKLLSTPS